MLVTTVRRKYPGEWVALRVQRTTKSDVPLAGEVVAHATNRLMLHQRALAYRGENPGARLFIFFAGDPIPEGLGVCLALARGLGMDFLAGFRVTIEPNTATLVLRPLPTL